MPKHEDPAKDDTASGGILGPYFAQKPATDLQIKPPEQAEHPDDCFQMIARLRDDPYVLARARIFIPDNDTLH